MPLFVRGGSIVPMGPDVEYATEKPADPIELRVYPGSNGTFTLYEDENDNYDYEKGVHATIRFDYDDAARKFTIGAREGNFRGCWRRERFAWCLCATGRVMALLLRNDRIKLCRIRVAQ